MAESNKKKSTIKTIHPSIPGLPLDVPVLALRDIVVFPGSVMPLFIGRKRSLAAIEKVVAEHGDKEPKWIALVAQKNSATKSPGVEDLHDVCTLASVRSLLMLQNKMMKIVIQGHYRVRIDSFQHNDDAKAPFVARVVPFTEKIDGFKLGNDAQYRLPTSYTSATQTLDREILLKSFQSWAKTRARFNTKVLKNLARIEDLNQLTDVVVAQLPLDVQARQKILAEENLQARVKELNELLLFQASAEQSEVSSPSKSKKSKNPQQEAMEALQEEMAAEFAALEQSLYSKPLSDEARERVQRELKKLRLTSMMSAEASVVRSYLDWVAALPWLNYSEDRIDIQAAQKILDEDHYGLDKIKDRILEHLAVQKLVERPRAPILCLAGPPGVGKTSLVKSIARATGREYVRLSLGGVRDESEIRGHRRTYIGAMPGKIIAAFKRAGTSNPVMLLDEIDKMSTDFRGDPSAALLEVLDPEQNSAFVDHYLDLDYDLSRVLFICTANNLGSISGPLRDRMEILRLSGYTDTEKKTIAKNYLIPKQLEANGLAVFKNKRLKSGRPSQERGAKVKFQDSALSLILDRYTREAGVRDLERVIGTCARKTAIELLSKQGEPTAKDCAKARKLLQASTEGAEVESEFSDDQVLKRARREKLNGLEVSMTPERVRACLGVERYRRNRKDKKNQIGVTNGLAYTSVGGEVLLTEVLLTPGKGKLQITGKLGDVMQESVKAAMAYVRSRALNFGLPPDFYDRIDVHLHVPKGATPKDGPSAGITIATSLVSALTKIPVRKDVAMTGEITLLGKVLPIGGLKEKSLAAYREGIKEIIIPADNVIDLEDIPEKITSNLKYTPVEHLDEVLELALAHPDILGHFKSLSKNDVHDVFDLSPYRTQSGKVH